MPKSKNRKKKSRSGKNRTSLQDHKKVGSQLQSGFAQLEGKLVFSSWANERLPEMLWAAIIRVIEDQDFAISEFQRILSFIASHAEKEKLSDVTLSGISRLPEGLREQFIGVIIENNKTASALVSLLLFDNLPAKSTWAKLLPKEKSDVSILMDAIGFNFPHQSEEATDCRWLKLMAQLMGGKMHVPHEKHEEWANYPYKGDLRRIRPSIRAAEMVENPLIKKDLSWPKIFWHEAWEKSPCLALTKTKNKLKEKNKAVSQDNLLFIVSELETHWFSTHSTTGIDARHDAVFGISFYVLRVLNEMLSSELGTGVLGRLGLRTILESHISLRYLLHKDDIELWKQWRKYGAGQAKLNALRFDELMEAPKHIDKSIIEAIAGEDIWEEFLNIELGSWSGTDLRRVSEKAGVKDSYDAHYSWTSGYSHGTWGPIRESCFETCGNPLHRLHRYPHTNVLPDTISDACLLVNSILDDLDKAYPGFTHRLPNDAVL